MLVNELATFPKNTPYLRDAYIPLLMKQSIVDLTFCYAFQQMKNQVIVLTKNKVCRIKPVHPLSLIHPVQIIKIYFKAHSRDEI